MARRTVTVRYCDRCDSTEGTERRTILVPDARKQGSFDACAKCREEVSLAEWERIVMTKGPRATTRRFVVPEAVAKRN